MERSTEIWRWSWAKLGMLIWARMLGYAGYRLIKWDNRRWTNAPNSTGYGNLWISQRWGFLNYCLTAWFIDKLPHGKPTTVHHKDTTSMYAVYNSNEVWIKERPTSSGPWILERAKHASTHELGGPFEMYSELGSPEWLSSSRCAKYSIICPNPFSEIRTM